MQICVVNLVYDDSPGSPESIVTKRPLQFNLGCELTQRGHEIHIVQAFPDDRILSTQAGTWHLIKAGTVSRGVGNVLSRFRKRSFSGQTPHVPAIRTIAELNPDIIHFHGATLHLNHFLLNLMRSQNQPPVVVHYHGGMPASSGIRRWIQQYNFRRTDRFLFTSHGTAQPFVEHGLLEDGLNRVEEFMEVSTTFKPRNAAHARQETAMTGDPVCLSVARLDPVKDPQTVVKGFELLLAEKPDARLYMYYGSDTLEPEIRTYLAEIPELERAVELRGTVPHAELEAIYNSADLFLQASRREYSSYSVLEAMACGVVPVVSDIPAFRTMTEHSQYGCLFPVGDAQALADRVLEVLNGNLGELQRETRRHFQENFSYPKLAARLEGIYLDLLADHNDSS